jgi:hypothetical protein
MMMIDRLNRDDLPIRIEESSRVFRVRINMAATGVKKKKKTP